MTAIPAPDNENVVVDMAEWIRSTLEAVDAAADIHDMRTELANRLYSLHLKLDPTLRGQMERVAEMIRSDDNSDRIPPEKFGEWAKQFTSS